MAEALVLFSHGSLLCGSGEMLQRHADNLRATGQYIAVEPGYLNYSTPSIEAAVEKCAAAGAVHITVVPYFLVAGKFVTVDLPARLRSVIGTFPHILFSIAEPLGFSDEMLSAAKDVIATATAPGAWQSSAIKRAQAQCELRKDCPVYGTPMCRAGQQQ